MKVYIAICHSEGRITVPAQHLYSDAVGCRVDFADPELFTICPLEIPNRFDIGRDLAAEVTAELSALIR